ncbi:IclR family transcriptional regulator [Lutispora saccharofermentans]|uniref:IclR family transcriptional regulator n=1 Tax=Lutispora saccharofermentans TaxID=3024236 RepID=A0ABT1NCQ9_9FIRM|nr:IclR family transcriptional regulator [Lutispora saccharofermentans]MCQ1529048.1 IclR family transcriptional regulator [Lutispora saccharofermentans]
MTNKAGNGGSGLIKSVQKSLKILKYIIDADDEVNLSDIEKALGYNVSTVHHLLKTLMEEGFVSQNKITRKYDIGPEIFFAWLGGRKPENYFSRVTPILEECVQETGETTNLFIRDDNEAVCITGCESKYTLRAFLKIGRRIPLTSTAAGKAFLVNLRPEDLKKYLPNTSKDLERLSKELEDSRVRGYTLEIEEFEDMITAIGVPVIDHNGRVICALSTIAPSVRIDKEKIDLISKALINASNRITEIMEGVFY